MTYSKCPPLTGFPLCRCVLGVKHPSTWIKVFRKDWEDWQQLGLPKRNDQMGISKNNGTPKSSHFNRVFQYKPSILGYHYFWKHPNGSHHVFFFPECAGMNEQRPISRYIIIYIHTCFRYTLYPPPPQKKTR